MESVAYGFIKHCYILLKYPVRITQLLRLSSVWAQIPHVPSYFTSVVGLQFWGINQLPKYKHPLASWWPKVTKDPLLLQVPIHKGTDILYVLCYMEIHFKIIWSSRCFTIILNAKCCRSDPKILCPDCPRGIQLVNQPNSWRVCSRVLSHFHLKCSNVRGIHEIFTVWQERENIRIIMLRNQTVNVNTKGSIFIFLQYL